MLCYPFNASIWNALVLTVPSGIVILPLTFCTLRKGHYYFFGPKHNNNPTLKSEGVRYDTLGKRYLDIATLLITLSTAVIGRTIFLCH